MWTAFMNLEAIYGTPQTLGRVFARAQAAADPEAIHFALLGVYARAGESRRAEAEALYAITAKKFGRSAPRVWCQWAAFLFRGGNAAGARELLPKALTALPKPRHVEVRGSAGRRASFCPHTLCHTPLERRSSSNSRCSSTALQRPKVRAHPEARAHSAAARARACRSAAAPCLRDSSRRCPAA